MHCNRACTIEIMHLDDPYHELGLAPGSSDAEVKAAWRRLSARWHPDRNDSPQALRKIQRINRALEAIRRARGEPEAEAEDPAPGAEPTVEHPVSLTLEEVVTGCVREVRGEVVEDCADCEGSGLQLHATECSECSGAGHIRQHLWFAWVSSTVECTACQGHGKTRQGCTACAASGKAPASKYRCRVQVAPGARWRPARCHSPRARQAAPAQAGAAPARGAAAARVLHGRSRRDLEVRAARRRLCMDGQSLDRGSDPRGLQQMKLRRGYLSYRIKNAGLPWTNEAEAADCIVTVVPMFPEEFSREQEAAIDRLVTSNSGAAGTSAGDRMAAWTRLVDSWQDRRR
ncbi:DnaJ domain-containing protein [Polaromonas sp. P1(28)-13]|nr:DnaJ domain-containing protein [Polaromonas sp. P1(28)-13]